MNTALACNVTQIAGRWTAEKYEHERQQIRATHGDTTAEAGAKRDQALAALFYLSGWTQEELAKAEGCTHQNMAYRMRFGRFLQFATMVAIPRNLTERRFRDYWERTNKTETNDRIRFGAVLKLIEADTRLGKVQRPKTELGKSIVKRFADDQWHKVETIVAAHPTVPQEDVVAVLEGMRGDGTYQTHCERKQVGTSQQYKIVHHDNRTIALDVLMKELGPILEGFEAQGKKTVVTVSIDAISDLARKLRHLIEKLAK